MAASSSASYSLASPQVDTRISVASCNMTGGELDFMTNKASHRSYALRFEDELTALLDGRDMAGLTEINPHWFLWMRTHHPSFRAGQYSGFHDGHDCAIVYDRAKLEPISELSVTEIFLPSEIPRNENAKRFNWRQVMAVDFRYLASPQVTFTAACTHSIRGGKDK